MPKNAEKTEGNGPGGARPGAGRKRLYGRAKTRTVGAAVPTPLLSRLDAWAERQGVTRSQAIVEAVRRLVAK